MAASPSRKDSHDHNMEQDQPETTKMQTTVNGYLFTPPEDNMDSFSQVGDEELRAKGWEAAVRNTLPPIQDHTPPASPNTNTLPSIKSATGYLTHDAPLYPEQSRTGTERSQIPLFEPSTHHTPSPPVQPAKLAATSQSPNFPANLGIETPREALQYWQDRMHELRLLKAIQLPQPRMSATKLDDVSQRQLHSLSRSSGIARSRAMPRSTPARVTKPKAPMAASPDKSSPPKRRTPKTKTYSDFVETAFPSAQQATKYKRAPPTKKTDGDRVHWTELPNYAPPSSDLDTNSKPLKVSWASSALSLADDPDRVHLHPQEVVVSSTLRLPCSVYLYNKRKIFQARLQAFKDGKNFTKTAAQSACHIDVNKASQLWEAFDRVGWFDRRWFDEWL